jgi:hypothetical protein
MNSTIRNYNWGTSYELSLELLKEMTCAQHMKRPGIYGIRLPKANAELGYYFLQIDTYQIGQYSEPNSGQNPFR